MLCYSQYFEIVHEPPGSQSVFHLGHLTSPWEWPPCQPEALTLHDCPPPHLPCTFPFLLDPSLTLLIGPLLWRWPPTCCVSPLQVSPPYSHSPYPTGLRDPTLHHHESLHNFSQRPMLIYASGLNHSGGGWEGSWTLNWFQLLGCPSRGGSRVRLSPSPALHGQ